MNRTRRSIPTMRSASSWKTPPRYRNRIVCFGSILTIHTTQYTSDLYKKSALCQIQQGLNLNEYEPHLAGKKIVHPAQNCHFSSSARVSHTRGCSTGVGLTRRQVPVPWGVKFITNSPCYNAQRDKSLSYALRELVRSAASVRSLCQLDEESSRTSCAFFD